MTTRRFIVRVSEGNIFYIEEQMFIPNGWFFYKHHVIKERNELEMFLENQALINGNIDEVWTREALNVYNQD